MFILQAVSADSAHRGASYGKHRGSREEAWAAWRRWPLKDWVSGGGVEGRGEEDKQGCDEDRKLERQTLALLWEGASNARTLS